MSENSLSSSSARGRPDFNGKGSRFSKPLFFILLIAGLAFAVELDFLKGREKFPDYDVFSLLHYNE